MKYNDLTVDGYSYDYEIQQYVNYINNFDSINEALPLAAYEDFPDLVRDSERYGIL